MSGGLEKIRVFLSTAEVSGDIAGGLLAKTLQDKDPSVSVIGCGGRHMRDSGVEILVPSDTFGVIGLSEIIFFIPKLIGAFWKIRTAILKQKPQVAVLVGYEGFHVPLALWLKYHRIYTISYHPPQVWLWERFAGLISSSYDEILACFPDELRVYSKAGGNVSFVGHYLKDVISPFSLREKIELRKQAGVSEDERVIALLPGSRRDEVFQFTTILLDTALELKQKDPGICFTLPIAAPAYDNYVREKIAERELNNVIVCKSGPEAMAISDLVLVASGTAALESALLEIPHIIFYRLSRLTVGIVRFLQRLGIIQHDRIGLPNLLLKRKVVPEIYQSEVNPRKLAKKAWSVMEDTQKYYRICEDLREIRHLLGTGNATEHSAEIILERSIKNTASAKRSECKKAKRSECKKGQRVKATRTGKGERDKGEGGKGEGD